MTTAKAAQGTRTQLSASSLNSLASATYVVLGTITFNSGGKTSLNAKLEIEITPGSSPSGSKQAKVFAQLSMDGTNFETGPTSGTTVTDEPVLTPIGVVPLNTGSTLQRKMFDLGSAFGSLPYAAKIIVFNDSGTAFASSGHDCYYTNIDGDLT